MCMSNRPRRARVDLNNVQCDEPSKTIQLTSSCLQSAALCMILFSWVGFVFFVGQWESALISETFHTISYRLKVAFIFLDAWSLEPSNRDQLPTLAPLLHCAPTKPRESTATLWFSVIWRRNSDCFPYWTVWTLVIYGCPTSLDNLIDQTTLSR